MPVIRIDTLAHKGLEPFASLTDKGLRQDEIFIAESPNVIERALEAGVEAVSLLCEERHISGDAAEIIARVPQIPVYTGSRALLASLTGYTLTRGVLCAMKRPQQQEAESLARNARRLCVIYDICDATNIGVIFRSAAALGFDAILLSAGSCDPLNRRAIRVSMGAVFQIPWAFTTSVLACLRQAGFKSVCTALTDNSVSLEEFGVEPEGKYAVIFGSEGYGLPREVISGSDITVRIPMHAGVDSLNVGAAAAITLWHFRPTTCWKG